MEPRLHQSEPSPSFTCTRFLHAVKTQSKIFDIAKHIRHLSDDDRLFIKEHLAQTIIPELARNMSRNRMRIAISLCFTDGRLLDTETRKKMGLIDAHRYYGLLNPKTLPALKSSGHDWNTDQCHDAERVMRYNIRARSGEGDGVFRSNGLAEVPTNINSCMMGKQDWKRSGLCYESTLFPNGTVFIAGIWYVMDQKTGRSYDKLISRIRRNKGKVPPYVTKTGNVWNVPYFGGLWQPTRAFRNTETSRIYTSRHSLTLHDF